MRFRNHLHRMHRLRQETDLLRRILLKDKMSVFDDDPSELVDAALREPRADVQRGAGQNPVLFDLRHREPVRVRLNDGRLGVGKRNVDRRERSGKDQPDAFRNRLKTDFHDLVHPRLHGEAGKIDARKVAVARASLEDSVTVRKIRGLAVPVRHIPFVFNGNLLDPSVPVFQGNRADKLVFQRGCPRQCMEQIKSFRLDRRFHRNDRLFGAGREMFGVESQHAFPAGNGVDRNSGIDILPEPLGESAAVLLRPLVGPSALAVSGDFIAIAHVRDGADVDGNGDRFHFQIAELEFSRGILHSDCKGDSLQIVRNGENRFELLPVPALFRKADVAPAFLSRLGCHGKFKFDSLEIALGLKDVFRAHFAAHADEISGKRFRGERL